MTTRAIEVIGPRTSEEVRRMSITVSQAEHDMEDCALAAAKDLATKMSLQLCPEVGHEEAEPGDYEARRNPRSLLERSEGAQPTLWLAPALSWSGPSQCGN